LLDLEGPVVSGAHLPSRSPCYSYSHKDESFRDELDTHLNHVGKDLREIQELLRHKNIRTAVRYTHVGYERTRQTAEALSKALD